MREHETKEMTDIMKCGCLVAELSVRGACTVLRDHCQLRQGLPRSHSSAKRWIEEWSDI